MARLAPIVVTSRWFDGLDVSCVADTCACWGSCAASFAGRVLLVASGVVGEVSRVLDWRRVEGDAVLSHCGFLANCVSVALCSWPRVLGAGVLLTRGSACWGFMAN